MEKNFEYWINLKNFFELRGSWTKNLWLRDMCAKWAWESEREARNCYAN